MTSTSVSAHPASGADDGSGRLDPRAVRVIVVSGAAVGMGASLGFIPGFLATALRDDLGISRGEVGLLVSVYFGCTGLGSILGGRLTDRFGARFVIVLDMLLVVSVGVLVASVGRYWAWLVAAVVAGAAYALANAGTSVAIAHSTPARRRTLAMSMRTAGVPIMASITAGFGPYAADRWSWQAIIWVAVGAAAVTAVAAALVLEPYDSAAERRVESRSLPPGFAWFAVAAFLLIAGSQPLYSWTVAYLEQSLDASPGRAGGVIAVASGVGVCFMILNALRADRVGPEQRIGLIVVLVAINAAATVLVLGGLVAGITIVLVGAVIGIAAQLASIGTMHATIIDRAPTAVARATGVTMTGYYLGVLVSPAAFGALADVTDTFAWSWLATIVFLLLAIPAWLMAGRVPVKGVVEANQVDQSPTNPTQENHERTT